MLITIITSLAIVVMAVAIVMLTLKTGTNEAALEKLTELTESKASEVDVQALKRRLAEEIGETSNAEREIAEIIRRMEKVSAEIKKLDERTEADHKNLVDIRQRYVLWREPTVPVITSGVPWADEIKCGDDND